MLADAISTAFMETSFIITVFYRLFREYIITNHTWILNTLHFKMLFHPNRRLLGAIMRKNMFFSAKNQRIQEIQKIISVDVCSIVEKPFDLISLITN